MANDNLDLDAGGESASQGKTAPAKSSGNAALIMVALAVMIVTPVASFFVARHVMSSSPRKATERAAIENPTIMSIDPLVVNIAGTRMTRVLRLQVHLVLSEPRLPEKLREDMMPMIKDRIMTTAGRRTLEDLEELDGRESLKRDIVIELNSLIRDRMSGSVLDVAFSEFLIQ